MTLSLLVLVFVLSQEQTPVAQQPQRHAAGSSGELTLKRHIHALSEPKLGLEAGTFVYISENPAGWTAYVHVGLPCPGVQLRADVTRQLPCMTAHNTT